MSEQLNPNQKMLEFVKRAGTLINSAEKKAAAWAQKEAAVSALIPDVVDALISSGKVSESLREKAASHLTDHVKTLELLASVATYKSETDVGYLGGPAKLQKTASSRVGENSPYVGAIVDEDERPSGRGLVEAILGNR